MMTRDDLIAFEADVAECFNRGEIRAPIHLDGGNESQLIEVFKDIDPHDWVLCSWRSHYKALLKGIPPAAVKAEIMAGRSIALCFPEHRFLSSAIVGGHLPIAVGLAWAAKRNGWHSDRKQGRVWAFVGDMGARGGMYHECLAISEGLALPITFVIEDNGKSVCTETDAAWGGPRGGPRGVDWWGDNPTSNPAVVEFSYKLPWPHSGAGVRVEF